MSEIHDPSAQPPSQAHPIERSDSSSSTTPSDQQDDDHVIQQPIPTRPRLPSRRSSGPMVVPRDSSAVGPVDSYYGPDDVRSMSPRRTSEDIDKLGKEAREEMRRSVHGYFRFHALSQFLIICCRHAKALQDSLLTIFNRIEAVREEHDKLDNNNKFLQKYIGDLMSTSKITASSSRAKK
ncbi:hypothetical protein HJFPF1_06055 [Paramyrothecium foliicola]|nr:hypothetical protein HJFPF1_06055 [Paramyrothecium foliicola]